MTRTSFRRGQGEKAPAVPGRTDIEDGQAWVRKGLTFPAIALEPISKRPQQDADASEVDEAQEVLGVSLVAGDQTPVVLEPGEQAFDLPSAPVSTQESAILGLPFAGGQVRGDEFDPALLAQALVQAVAVVGLVSDQTVGGVLEEAVVDRLLDEGDLMWRSTGNPTGDRKTSAVCNCHDLGPLPALRLSDARAPVLAPAKVPSMKASVMSSPPRS